MRMSVCFKPCCFSSLTGREILPFMYVKGLNIICNIGEDKLIDILHHILREKCNLNAFGFNKKDYEFWGKKFKKDKFSLHLTIKIKHIEPNWSIIIITPLVGNEKDYTKLICTIKDIINLHN